MQISIKSISKKTRNFESILAQNNSSFLRKSHFQLNESSEKLNHSNKYFQRNYSCLQNQLIEQNNKYSSTPFQWRKNFSIISNGNSSIILHSNISRNYSVIRGLASSFSNALSSLKSSSKISDTELNTCLSKVEEALMEADVNSLIVKKFIEDCRVDYSGLKSNKGLPPSAAVYGKIKERLILYLGGNDLPTISDRTILMVGTQGSGKTTTASKLAYKLAREDLKVLTVSLDTSRPAAMKQLQIMSQRAGVDFYERCLEMNDPIKIAQEVIKYRDENQYDCLIVDTAGRMHVDNSLMKELQEINTIIEPTETMLVADAMLGNDSVKIAREFSDQFGVTGIILTRFDSNARGGAAISMRYVTGVPIKYIGIGEKVEDFEMFIPKVAAGRILGEGEIDSLATQYMSAQSDLKDRDFTKDPFTMEDFINYMDRLNRGSFISDLMGAIVKRLGVKVDEEKLEEGIDSLKSKLDEVRIIYAEMLPEERKNPLLLKASSARRIRIQKRTDISLKRIQESIAMYETMKRDLGNNKKKVQFSDFKEEMHALLDRVGGFANMIANRNPRSQLRR